MNRSLQMVDLRSQYLKIKPEVDEAIQRVIDESSFINGPAVEVFATNLAEYLGAKYVIPCANGTDALQIALMALGLQPGDEVIVPCFTYVATAEVIALLQLKPVLTDVDPKTFNITAELIEKVITSKTRAIVPVHLFGQSADIEPIMALAKKYNLYVVEDTAQAIGADYSFSTGEVRKCGTIGHIGTTSFFPSKNLGCYGDGGALVTDDADFAGKIKMIANHGQSRKYYHEVIGVNSRLDTIQAAILNVKLRELDKYAASRSDVAAFYDTQLGGIDWLEIPEREKKSTHVFHQYTLKLKQQTDRNQLKNYLESKGIPSMVYYPVPLHLQEAFKTPAKGVGDYPITESLCTRVLSLPIHTEMGEEEKEYITSSIKSFK
ncbi:DegT/DnrJ/EryC1/StrS family aminotransferase [Daejeonella sp. JGW-45]|uniref:DegT/DnrJ/EryC1/StrS family aminotransferase n=1 Tax=Daejeonella sp. JGW-45 TaxID=3034148 RepID=UPI0023EE09C9|nr:DegT/DnrJ/EryC1/StrS family aminotransferase [Daejeonella sp. JGW-45]